MLLHSPLNLYFLVVTSNQDPLSTCNQLITNPLAVSFHLNPILCEYPNNQHR